MVTEAKATPNIGELRAKLDEAITASQAAEQKLTVIRNDKDSDLAALMAAANEFKATEDAVARARKAIDAAEFESKAGERDAALEKVRELVTGGRVAEALNKAGELGVKGISITFGENGLEVTAAVPKAPGKSTGGTGTRRGSITWTYNGTEYTSRELLSAFHEDSEKVFERAAAGAGFDQPVKQLAKKLGAVGTRKDGSLVELD